LPRSEKILIKLSPGLPRILRAYCPG